jgi:hypothetical protein
LIQSQASCQLDDPETILEFGFGFRSLPKSEIQNPQFQIELGFGETRTRNFRFRRPVFLIPLNYEAEKMEGTRGFEPPTCSFVMSRADSVAPRPQDNLGFGIYSFNPKSKIHNPKSISGALRFERRTSVLETDDLPVKLRAYLS